MEKLFVFDVDGTLIDTEIGSWKDLGVMLGKEKEVKEHDAEYQKRKHLGPWGLEELAMIFKGVEEKTIQEAVQELLDKKLMAGAQEVLEELKRREYTIVSYSSSPMWVMQALKERFKLDDVCGNRVEVKEGKITGKLLEKADRYTKAERLKHFLDKTGISKENTFVVGDSVTDLPMAKYGHFIAFNPEKEEVRKAAEFVVKKKDLREILQFLP